MATNYLTSRNIVLGVSVIFSLFLHSSAFARENENYEQALTNFSTEKGSSKGLNKESKLVALQTGKSYQYSDSVLSQPPSDIGLQGHLSEYIGEISFSPILDQRERLQRHIFPFHFFW